MASTENQYCEYFNTVSLSKRMRVVASEAMQAMLLVAFQCACLHNVHIDNVTDSEYLWYPTCNMTAP
jgi:hypothetical protein